MPFVKVIKNKAYFSRFQVAYKRRRQGKTDYKARRAMVMQDKTKYSAPKYRLVARRTNRDIIAQIVHSTIPGDRVLAAAYSHELPAYGVSVGLTNYAAAYCTGLLVARRALKKLKLDKKFEGVKEATGEYKAPKIKGSDEDDGEGRYPFRAVLDVGLTHTTTGNRVFAVLKGAVDGGVAVPHNPRRFPGWNKAKSTLDAAKLRDRIHGKHVAAWLALSKKNASENADAANPQFKAYIAKKVDGASLEKMYKDAHKAIRADPTKTVAKKNANGAATRKNYSKKALTNKERSAAAKKKVESIRARLKKAGGKK